MKTKFCVLLFSLLAILAENAAFGQPKERDYWPTKDWRFSTPELQGMDPAKLMIADEFIQNRLPDTFSLLVVRKGYLVFEKYYSWGSPYKYAVVHSVTKSVTSALIGMPQIRCHVCDEVLRLTLPMLLGDQDLILVTVPGPGPVFVRPARAERDWRTTALPDPAQG